MTNRVTSADGTAIAYDVEGSGKPALVFVHGWSCDRSYWAGQMSGFRARHCVVAVDLAGHGESGETRVSWTVAAFADDVVAVVTDLDLDEVVLVGHSMGGDVITEAALALAGRVRGLVWVDAYASLESLRGRDEASAFVEPFRGDFVDSTRRLVRRMFSSAADPALVERVASDMSSAPPAIALDVLLHAISYGDRLLQVLPSVGVPIVAINPDYRPTDEASLRRHGVRPILMAGAGHFLMMDDPRRFNEILAGVLDDFVPSVTS